MVFSILQCFSTRIHIFFSFVVLHKIFKVFYSVLAVLSLLCGMWASLVVVLL